MPRPGWASGGKQAICFGCYTHGHILPNCQFPISDFPKIIENYEKLTPDDKARVPQTHYDIAKRFVEAKQAEKADEANGTKPVPKN